MLWAFGKTIIKDLFQEDNGKWSLSRLTSALCVVAPIIWVSYIVFKLRQPLPDLTSPALFIGAGGTHYGVGKYMEIAKAKLGLGTTPPPEQP